MVQHYEGLGHAHFLTFSCYRKQLLFNDRYLCELYQQHLIEARQRHKFSLWAYVIMPSHVHMLIFPKSESRLSTLLHAVKRPFSYNALMYLRSVGSTYVSGLPLSEIDNKIGHRFWQHGGGYDRNIFSTRVLKKTVDYIHNNPVKAGLVKEATDWKWSSARYWILGEEGMVHIDEMQL